MKRRVLVRWVGVLAVPAAVYLGWQWASWDTICSADAPDGSRRAVVRCHWVPTVGDGRYHYYLTFEPPVEFRPAEGESTLKTGPSAVKDERVSSAWATTHFIGYLQGFDGVADRGPSEIAWEGGRVVVRGRERLVGVFELRE